MVTNRTVYTFIIIGILILTAVGVNAFNSGGPASEIGHTFNDEIQPPTGCNNLFIKVNSAGTGWVCEAAGGVDTNAATICSGTDVYLDGEGNCDTISGGGTFDGTGTANYITRFVDPNTLTSSTIYQSGNNIGIGITSPGTRLEVRDSLVTDASSGQIRVTQSSTNPMNLGRTADYGFIQTHNGDPLVLNPLGNLVAIGKTNPSAGIELDVVGDVRASGTMCDSVGCIGSGGGSDTDWVISGNDIYRNLGVVGIGTTTPDSTYKLDVNGYSNFRNNVYASEVFAGGTDVNSRVCRKNGINCPTHTLGCTRSSSSFSGTEAWSTPCQSSEWLTGGGCECSSGSVLQNFPATGDTWKCKCSNTATNHWIFWICCSKAV